MRQSILLACLVGPAACSPDTTNAAEDDAVRALKLKLWQKGKECHECRSTSDFEAAVAHARFNPVWHLRGGCDEKEMHCGVQAPALDMLVAKLGPAFGKAIDDNIADHAKDCAKSCETFYCGPGPKRTLESTHFANYSMGDVPPEDFSSDFRFPLDLIKVTGDAHPLFTREECAAVVATAESEDVHLNEYVSGKYKLGGDWMYNLPKTLEWFNRNLKEKIFPTLAVLFPEVISGPEVLRAHSVAMLKYNNTHPRTDVHVDNGVIALTLALSPSENYEGGGTFFEHMGDEPLQMDAGHATFRPGSVRHGGHTVTRGERYIIGAFILIEDKVEHVRRLNGRGRDARNRNTKEGNVEAMQYFSWGLEMNPTCVTCLKNWGEVLMAEERYSEAEVKFRAATDLTPRDSDGLYNLGGVLKAQGKVDESIETYYRSLEINADDWELCYNLGVALGDQQRFVEEAAMYKKALAINPKHAKAWGNLGIALASSGSLEESVEPFTKACELEPTNGQAWHNLAKTLTFLKRGAEADAAKARAAALGVGGAPRPVAVVNDVEDF